MAGILETGQFGVTCMEIYCHLVEMYEHTEIRRFVAMLFTIRRNVDTKMGPGFPSTFITDNSCHADALIRQDICIKLRDIARQLDILLGSVHNNAKDQLVI
jgi:hypothetical protein